MLINVIYFGRAPLKAWSRFTANLTVSILIFGMGLSRPTSGVVGLLTVLAYLLVLSFKNLRLALAVLALQLFVFLIVIIPNLYNFRYRLLESVKISKSFDPKGYSIPAEIQDVVFSVISLLLISILVFLCSRYLICILKPHKTKAKVIYPNYSLPIITATLLAVIYIYPRIQISSPNLGFLLSMIVINSILGAYLIGVREFSALWILSSLPYTSQFGSNTPAIGNVQILFQQRQVRIDSNNQILLNN